MTYKKILVHDFCGHPFQVELSREFSRRGHTVVHAYFAGAAGPKGKLERMPEDPASFSIAPIDLGGEHLKYSLVKRWLQERNYARSICGLIARERPDVVISSNTPLDPQSAIRRVTHAYGGQFVFWLQDVQSVAIKKYLPRKLPGLGHAVASHYERREKNTLRKSDLVVCISEDFLEHLSGWGVDRRRSVVIENWASKNDIIPMNKDNPWSRRHRLADKKVFLYAGTLGLKHNPDLLRQLAVAYANDPSVAVVVASEGMGADWLKEKKATEGLNALTILPFQPFSALSEMLAAGDVLISVIEPDAGRFSVPSKVLSYLAAGRTILLAVPPENLAARVVERAGAGRIGPPSDARGFVAAARELMADPERRAHHAAAARRHAETHFDVVKIADRFLAALEG